MADELPPVSGLELTEEELNSMEEEVGDDDFLDTGAADQDDTVDNREVAEPPNDSSQLPDENSEEEEGDDE